MTVPLPPPRPDHHGEKDQKNRSCWVTGCGGCLLVLFLLILLGMFMTWQFNRSFKVEAFAPLNLSAAEEAEIRGRLRSLKLLDAEGRPASEPIHLPAEGLSLSETEVNYLISQQAEGMSDSIRLDFEPGELTMEIRMGPPEGKRLRMNAKVSVPASGNFQEVRLEQLKIGNFPVPVFMMDELRGEDLDIKFYQNPGAQKAFEAQVERIEIQKDRILFVPRSGPSGPP